MTKFYDLIDSFINCFSIEAGFDCGLILNISNRARSDDMQNYVIQAQRRSHDLVNYSAMVVISKCGNDMKKN